MKIRHTKTLVYYDGPQVFEARDAIGGHYIAVMGDSEKLQYLVAGVAPESLHSFFDGVMDLRALVLESEPDARYTTSTMPGGVDDELEVKPFREALDGFLPDPGYVPDKDDLLASDLLAHTGQREDLLLEMALEAPAGRVGTRAYTEVIHQVQTLIKHVLVSVKGERDSWRLSTGMLDVVTPAARGSLRVLLGTSSQQGPTFNARMSEALRIVDTLFPQGESMREAVLAAKENSPPVAGAYVKLLRLLSKNKTGLRYAWTGGGVRGVRNGSVSRSQAATLANTLTETQPTGETFVREGELYRCNSDSGRWGLLTTEGFRLRGRVKHDGPELAGLQVGRDYRFTCEVERSLIAEDGVITYLVHHEPLANSPAHHRSGSETLATPARLPSHTPSTSSTNDDE